MLRKRGNTPSTAYVYARASLLFKEFLGKELDAIVEEYQSDVKANAYDAFEKWESIFDDFADWLKKRYGGTTPATLHAGALALINANVPRSRQLKAKSPEVYAETIPPIPIEDLKEIDNRCDERERTFLRILKDSGMSRSDAVRLNYGQIRQQLEQGESFVRIEMTREKEHVKYETFIGPNAVDMLRLYMQTRERSGEKITDDTPIFADAKGKRLSSDALAQMFLRITQRTGKTISSHRLRKFFETYMAIGVRHPVFLKYWMGHKLRSDIEARYIIPPTPEQLKMYKESYKNIDLTGVSFADLQKRQEIVEELQSKILSGEPLTDEDRTSIRRYNIRLFERIKRKNDITEKKALREVAESLGLTEKQGKKRKRDTDCVDGQHCGKDFKQIGEVELLRHLNDGWQIVHRLGNGEVIVKK
jgi:integrase